VRKKYKVQLLGGGGHSGTNIGNNTKKGKYLFPVRGHHHGGDEEKGGNQGSTRGKGGDCYSEVKQSRGKTWRGTLISEVPVPTEWPRGTICLDGRGRFLTRTAKGGGGRWGISGGAPDGQGETQAINCKLKRGLQPKNLGSNIVKNKKIRN